MKKKNWLSPSAGRILISDPSLVGDPYFARSVVLLVEHNEEGSIGLVLNRPIDIGLDKVLEEPCSINAKLSFGGPVATDALFFIHSAGLAIPDSQKVCDGIFFGGDFATVGKMLLSGHLNPVDIRFFIGYSGWSPGQLEEELARKSWVVSEAPSLARIFSSDTRMLWRNSMCALGPSHAIWANYLVDPDLN